MISSDELSILLTQRNLERQTIRGEFLETGAKKFSKIGNALHGRVPPYPPSPA